MCRTVHNTVSSLICMLQMVLRVTMTLVLMLENLIRMVLQTIYNTVSFILQLLSLLPICIILIVTARMKCFMCGGGGGCPNRGGSGGCDCLMTFMALALLFLIFRATGVLDKIFFRLGYAKASHLRPTGGVTQCSRNDTEYYDDDKEKTENARKFNMRRVPGQKQMNAAKAVNTYEQITEELYSEFVTADSSSTLLLTDSSNFVTDISEDTINDIDDDASLLTSVEFTTALTVINKIKKKQKKDNSTDLISIELSIEPRTTEGRARIRLKPPESSKKQLVGSEMTTVLYYLVA